jgi:hypothetical protein
VVGVGVSVGRMSIGGWTVVATAVTSSAGVAVGVAEPPVWHAAPSSRQTTRVAQRTSGRITNARRVSGS